MSLRAPCLLLLVLSSKVMAAACWITSGASMNFGTVAAGDAASISTEVKFTCQADYGAREYLNVCLSSMDTPPFKMVTTGDQQGNQYTLLFRIFNSLAPSQELSTAAGGDLIEQTVVAESNSQVNGTFPLLATIPSGQSQLPVNHYYNYNMNLRIAWHSATSRQALQHCADGSAEDEKIEGGSHAEAAIGEGCTIQNVTPLDFGAITSTAALSATRSTATLTARCPAGTAFSLGMGQGNHASGNQRRLCNSEGQCLRYSLWQDAGATLPWGDQNTGTALNVSNAAGGTQHYTIYGEVPAQPLTGVGQFSDDVIVTLAY